MEGLNDCVESIDLANNMEPVGLWPATLGLLSLDEDDSIIALILSVIGASAQNNPKCQSILLEKYNVLAKIVDITVEKTGIKAVALKAIFAISCLLDNNTEALRAFIADGHLSLFEAILSASASTTDRIKFVLCGWCEQGILTSTDLSSFPRLKSVFANTNSNNNKNNPKDEDILR